MVAALALLSACTAVNIAGLRQATRFAVLLACIELGGLLLVIGLGLGAGESGRSLEWPAPGTAAGVPQPANLTLSFVMGPLTCHRLTSGVPVP